jgi:hypothetical protein
MPADRLNGAKVQETANEAGEVQDTDADPERLSRAR